MEGSTKASHDIYAFADVSSSPLSTVAELRLSPRMQDNATASPKPKSKAIPSRPKQAKRRVLVKSTPRKPKWNAENILTDRKSPLASADLRAILSNPMAWEVLGDDEKAEILALLPDEQHILSIGTKDARPDFVSLMNDDSFRHDCASYTENIAQGRHDPEWLVSAWSAHERRKMGDFDEFQDHKFREDWEVEVPEALKPRRRPAKADTDMKDAEKEVEAEGESTAKDDADELQNGAEEKVETKAIGSKVVRTSMRMDVDGDKSEDELA